MRFIGGPKDGEELFREHGEPAPTGEVTVTSTYFSVEDGEENQERTERHLYRADSFGNLRHVRRLS